MIYETEPDDFNPKMEIVSCFVEHEGKILLLHRQDNKPQGNTWGVPAGKVDGGEDAVNAMLREVSEETGFLVPSDSAEYHGKVFVRYSDIDFVYHMFRTVVSDKPNVEINPVEHKTHTWLTPEEALELELIQDEDWCIKKVYGV